MVLPGAYVLFTLKKFFISVFRFLLSLRTSQHWLAYQ
jgi:hypothetical protein